MKDFLRFLIIYSPPPLSRLQLHAALAAPHRLLLWLLWRCCRDLLQSDTQQSQPRPLIAPATFTLPGCCQRLVPTSRPFEVLRLCIPMIRIRDAVTAAAAASPFVFCQLATATTATAARGFPLSRCSQFRDYDSRLAKLKPEVLFSCLASRWRRSCVNLCRYSSNEGSGHQVFITLTSGDM